MPIARRLRVWRSGSALLDLASDRLESLECGLRPSFSIKKVRVEAVRKMGAFSALTRLELSEFRPAWADFAAVRKLPLQELVLLHCQNLEVELLVPGALLSLRKLFIRDFGMRRRKVSRQPEMMEKLAVCSQDLLSLPCLFELLGSAVLFNSMDGVLEKWHVNDYRKGSMTISGLDWSARPFRLKVWTKP